MGTRRVEVETLLGAWIEQVRKARLQTLPDLTKATGLARETLLGARRTMRRPHGATVAALGRYLLVGDAVVVALWTTPATYRAPDLRAEQRRVSDRLSQLAQLLDEVRTDRGHTLKEVAVQLVMGDGTMSRARTLDPGMHARTWARLAEYVGRRVEECKALAALPAVRVLQTYPVDTWNGVKWHPTVPAIPCGGCPFWEPCMRDVLQGDFAWCEEVIVEDLLPG